MISFGLSAVKENQSKSANLAAAIAEFERRGRQIAKAAGFGGNLIPPARSTKVDPETILKRRRKAPTFSERKLLREIAEAL